jgi:curved DNA-binding protein CbpA
MDSSVKSFSNHYETLQVAPTASNDEIATAFATQLRIARLRPEITIARLAQISVAYETLRDPIKRWAYDVSLGLKSESAPIATPSRASAVGSTLAERLDRASGPSPAPSSLPKEEPRTDLPDESRVASFIASSLREPRKDEEVVRPQSFLSRTSAEPPEPAGEAELNAGYEVGSFEENRSSRWRFYAAGGTGLAVAAILAAVILPHRSGDNRTIAPASPQTALTVPLPPPSPAPMPPLETPRTEAQAEARAPASTSTTAPASANVSPTAKGQTAAGGTSKAGSSEPSDDEKAQDQTAIAAPAEAPAETPAVGSTGPGAGTSSSLPLPNATVARTIERIGYACGSVVSTTAIEGAGPGVFRVMCSSGDSYQARPVHGRYHFRHSPP